MIEFILFAILWLLSGIIGGIIVILNDDGEIKVKDIPFIIQVSLLGIFTFIFVILFYGLFILEKIWNKWWKRLDQEKVLYSTKKKRRRRR